MIFFVGQSLSLIGDGVLSIAVGIWVKTLTNSSALAGLSFFFVAAPAIFAPILGVVVDRFRRKPLLIVINCVAAATVLVLLAVDTRAQLWVIYTALFLAGVVALIQSAALSAFFPILVDQTILGHANTVFVFLRNAARLIGPSLGAVLFALVGMRVVIIADSTSFVVAGVCIALIRVAEASSTRIGRTKEAVASGFQFLRRQRELRDVITALALGFAAIGLVEATSYMIVAVLGYAPEFVAVLTTAQALGALAIAIFVPPLLLRVGETRAVAIGLVICAVGGVALGVPVLPSAVVGSIILGGGVTVLAISSNTYLQRRTPPDLLGRVDSVASAALTLPYTVFIGLGAGLVALVSIPVLLSMMSLLMLCASFWLYRRKHD